MKEQLAADLKAAMLARDSFLSDVLKGLKSAIMYQEIAEKKRESGLTDPEIETLFAREAKKRLEAAELYKKGDDTVRADKEIREYEVIKAYLPEQMSEDEIVILIDEAIAQTGASEQKDMGRIIGLVKAKAGNKADGSVVAKLAKAKLQ